MVNAELHADLGPKGKVAIFAGGGAVLAHAQGLHVLETTRN